MRKKENRVVFDTLAFGYGLVEGPRADDAGGLYFSDVTRGGVYRLAADGLRQCAFLPSSPTASSIPGWLAAVDPCRPETLGGLRPSTGVHLMCANLAACLNFAHLVNSYPCKQLARTLQATRSELTSGCRASSLRIPNSRSAERHEVGTGSRSLARRSRLASASSICTRRTP